MVARFVRDEEVVGSNPATPTATPDLFPQVRRLWFSADDRLRTRVGIIMSRDRAASRSAESTARSHRAPWSIVRGVRSEWDCDRPRDHQRDRRSKLEPPEPSTRRRSGIRRSAPSARRCYHALDTVIREVGGVWRLSTTRRKTCCGTSRRDGGLDGRASKPNRGGVRLYVDEHRHDCGCRGRNIDPG